MADAAVAVLKRGPEVTGRTFLDVDVLAEEGVTDLSRYGGGDEPEMDFFVERDR
jgi:citronellol/citronellal dehydrogenase